MNQKAANDEAISGKKYQAICHVQIPWQRSRVVTNPLFLLLFPWFTIIQPSVLHRLSDFHLKFEISSPFLLVPNSPQLMAATCVMTFYFLCFPTPAKSWAAPGGLFCVQIPPKSSA